MHGTTTIWPAPNYATVVGDTDKCVYVCELLFPESLHKVEWSEVESRPLDRKVQCPIHYRSHTHNILIYIFIHNKCREIIQRNIEIEENNKNLSGLQQNISKLLTIWDEPKKTFCATFQGVWIIAKQHKICNTLSALNSCLNIFCIVHWLHTTFKFR